jgi:DNA mismatch repair protein MutS
MIEPFHGILFEGPHDSTDVGEPEVPAFFSDLNLDQVIESVTSGRDEYNLKPFFYAPLTSLQAIGYRHEILRDLEGKALFGYVGSFARKMRAMREHRAQAAKLYYKYQKQAWFLEAAEIYCDAVSGLAYDLTLVDLQSRGFLAFRQYVTDYAKSDPFTSLVAETKALQDQLAEVRYCLEILGTRVRVSKYDSQLDYSLDVEKTFERFQQGAVKDYRVKFSNWVDMNHVEARIVDLVAQLNPEVFLGLDSYCDRHGSYVDRTVGAFDREVQFYVAYLEYVERFKAAGLTVCYPDVCDQSKEVFARDAFDVALANKLVAEKSPIVCNDFYLKEPERIFVVTGPNQGGKTTFARTFGQLHYLTSLGCPVPGSEARLFLFDQLFTHFEKEEDLKNLSGKLEDDLVRIHEILEQATANSIVIMNESLTSTTLKDALFLGRKVLEQLIRLDLLCVFVTFVDELASLSDTTVSMVSTVVPENPALRTYKLVRRPADGLAYAAAIAEKYGLTYERLKGRIQGRIVS